MRRGRWGRGEAGAPVRGRCGDIQGNSWVQPCPAAPLPPPSLTQWPGHAGSSAPSPGGACPRYRRRCWRGRAPPAWAQGSAAGRGQGSGACGGRRSGALSRVRQGAGRLLRRRYAGTFGGAAASSGYTRGWPAPSPGSAQRQEGRRYAVRLRWTSAPCPLPSSQCSSLAHSGRPPAAAGEGAPGAVVWCAWGGRPTALSMLSCEQQGRGQ